MTVDRLSIVICTYNRAGLLRTTLAALGELDPVEQCDIEIVIVDNNSSDNTRQIIAEAAQKSPFPIRGFHEIKQGKSFALNRALGEARGDVLALTDDDVNPAHDWAARIVAAFRERPITFVFGKVLPQWAATPPAELLTKRAQDIWGPLAIVDYGDEPAAYLPEATGQRLPVGANL